MKFQDTLNHEDSTDHGWDSLRARYDASSVPSKLDSDELHDDIVIYQKHESDNMKVPDPNPEREDNEQVHFEGHDDVLFLPRHPQLKEEALQQLEVPQTLPRILP